VDKKRGGVWSVLNKNNSSKRDWSVFLKDENCNDLTDVANNFRAHFQDKIKKLHTPAQADHLIEVVSENYESTLLWDLSGCTSTEVLAAIDKLRPTLSRGSDQIPNRLLKELKFEIVEPLTYIFNRSIQEGVFPACWKIGTILPIYKKGSRSTYANYRPVCLMSNLGKLLEAVVQEKFIIHLEKTLPQNIYGFRPGRGTQDAVCNVLDNIHKLRANGKFVAVLGFDASSAFDLLQHDVIIQSLEAIRVGPAMMKWMKSFLEGCLVHVDIDGHKSSPWPVDVGVGQGRKLSPNLYNLGTLSQAILAIYSIFTGYADDSIDVVYGDTKVDCEKNILLTINQRVQWYRDIGLALNEGKTEFMGCGFTPDPIEINGTTINPSKKITFLGSIIEANLKLDEQTTKTCSKLRQAAARIRIEGRHFDVKDRRILFNSWAIGALQHNALAYLPNLSISNKSSIEVAYNAGIRSVIGLPKYGPAPISKLRKELKLPSVDDVTEKTLLVSAWKCLRNPQSNSLLEGPTTRGRSQKNLPHPEQKGHWGKTTESHLIKAWNRLPLYLKEEDNIRKVRYNVKKMLLSH